MATATIDKVLGLLEPHVRVSEQISKVEVDGALKFIAATVKSPALYQAFSKDPAAAIKKAGISGEKVKAGLLTVLIKALHDRSLSPGGTRAASTSTKESSSSEMYNWDKSSSYSEKTKGSIVGETTKFDGASVSKIDEVILQEIRELFNPPQPLVTPALVEKIRALGTSGR